jgi:phosphatidate phosphatase LPIN
VEKKDLKKNYKVQFTKSLTPTFEQLLKLNLKPGSNDITFTVKSRFQGTQTITGRIYLWDYTTKIIISDVDGTVTRSDILGQMLPRLGRDWSHKGIAKLFSCIKKNGYEILYLTSRPIG